MKIKDLIKSLQTFDPEASVFNKDDGSFYTGVGFVRLREHHLRPPCFKATDGWGTFYEIKNGDLIFD